MTEACIWANNFWFTRLRQPVMRVPKAVANQASRRLSQRMGMHLARIEDRDFVSGRLPCEIWEITAAEWRAWKRGNHPALPPPNPEPGPAQRGSPSPNPR